jgi:hexosaminidase
MSARELLSRSRLAIVIVGGLLGSACNPPAVAPPAPQSASIAPRVIPLPASLTVGAGAPFQITKETRFVLVGVSPETGAIAESLAGLIGRGTDFPFAVITSSESRGPGTIELRLASETTFLGEEGYKLTVTSDSVRLVAATPAGLFHGTQTIRQLLPADIESEIGADRSWPIPAVTIVDKPRFAWRGSMLDPARHFLTVKEVEQYIDLMALYKFNVLHLHLTDDQGWRIQINSRPNLTVVGSLSQMGGGRGGFYTQQDYQEIVRFAQARYITVVPEIEMPGHSSAATRSYPDVACPSTFCVDKEETYALLDDVVREVSALTPGRYLHIGGDEVEGLTPEQYAHFIERVEPIVNKYGKLMIGWEEIAKAHIKPTTIVQQWKSDSATAALKYGSKLILSPSDKIYLDMKYDANTQLGLTWAAMIEVNTAYNWDPAAYMPGVTEQNIVGVEAPIWGETLRNITAVEYLAMPRLVAVAEVGWTPQASRDWQGFRARLAAHAPRWNYLGVNYYRSPLVPW